MTTVSPSSAASGGRGFARPPIVPAPECELCPRLAAFRARNRKTHPTFHNAPVPSFGELDARVLVVGLAPGLKGANQTGRPFTGDFAGDLLYAALARHGFARGHYERRADDGFTLVDTRVTNAVRCVPPENRPTTGEIAECRPFLTAEIAAMRGLRVILALGQIAHNATLRALGLIQSRYAFAHAAEHDLPEGPRILDSYHCSRLNQNTGRLTEAQFDQIIGRLHSILERT